MTFRASPLPRLHAALTACVFAFASAIAHADPPRPAPGPPPAPPAIVEVAPAEPDSPRAAWQAFFSACREGHYAEAAKWLDLGKSTRDSDGARLAMELEAVLRRYAVVDDDDLSPRSDGEANDGLGATLEEVARIPQPSAHGNTSVRLVRRIEGGIGRWVFARPTVRSIDAWYSTLEDRWIRPHLPKALLREGPLDVLVWQWLALFVSAPLLFAFGRLVALVAVTLARRLLLGLFGEAARLTAMVAPIQLLVAGGTGFLVLRPLALDTASQAFARGALLSACELAVLWAGARSVDLLAERTRHSPLGHVPIFQAGLLPLVTKMTKLALVVVAVILSLSNLGYHVGSLLAGLGIGGLAFALAAQKTVENLFGAASIGLDQPFRIGDPIAIDGVKGIVEAVGIRSTRLRTESRSVVSMPNAKVAEMRIENFAPRDRFLLTATLPVPFSALTRVQTLLERLETIFDSHPDHLDPGTHAATVARIGPAGFELELKAYFRAASAEAFERLRHHIFLEVVRTLSELGIELTPSGGVLRLEGGAPGNVIGKQTR